MPRGVPMMVLMRHLDHAPRLLAARGLSAAVLALYYGKIAN
jgi:hypothetical protein